MSEYNKEDIKNLHYNNNNEIQYDYGGQTYHCSMEHLKEVFVSSWNSQQENKALKDRIDKALSFIINNFEFDNDVEDLLKILKGDDDNE